MFKMKINSVAAQVISITLFNAPYYRQIFFMEPYSDRLAFLVIRYLASESHQTTLVTINDVLVPLDTPLCPLQFYLPLSFIRRITKEQNLNLSTKFKVVYFLDETFTVSYGYHINVILSPKLLHWETILRVQALQLLHVFCNMPAFLPETLEIPPSPAANIISYIVLFLQVCNED